MQNLVLPQYLLLHIDELIVLNSPTEKNYIPLDRGNTLVKSDLSIYKEKHYLNARELLLHVAELHHVEVTHFVSHLKKHLLIILEIILKKFSMNL